MTTPHIPVPVTPFQLKIKRFCIWIETKFECRCKRYDFIKAIALAGYLLYVLFYAQGTWSANASWALWVPTWLLIGLISFWAVLQIVRRFHDLGRTGGLFWAIAVPFWALWKLIEMFPDLWRIWVVFCLWSIMLTWDLIFKNGTEGSNGYDGRHI
jgi:uncharacterized membrane protein YhaH (DUF805 family)